MPVGVIRDQYQQTRFVPITDRKKLSGAVLVGIGLGMWPGLAQTALKPRRELAMSPVIYGVTTDLRYD